MLNVDQQHLLETLLESLYLNTLEPVTLEKLPLLHEFFGHVDSFKERCEALDCVSFNHLIRTHRELFKPFLEIYTCANRKLYYYNKCEANSIPGGNNNNSIGRSYVPISFDDTIYFEKHNQDEYLDGRAEFSKLVSECQAANFVDYDGLVPLNRIQTKIKDRFPDRKFSDVIKEWFHYRHVETMVKEILVDDIDFFPCSDIYRKETRFRLKKGSSLEDILANIDQIRIGRQKFNKNLDHQLSLNNRPSSTMNQPEPCQRSNNYHRNYSNTFRHAISSVTTSPDTDSSDDENDNRIENAPYVPVTGNGLQSSGLHGSGIAKKYGEDYETPIVFKRNHRDNIKKFVDVQAEYELSDDPDDILN